ncbi:MAG: hypothetical protein HY653_07250 [Acidobacteria bacterium]|nr:hypothetical protein [Acidobacteriota bacterium]
MNLTKSNLTAPPSVILSEAKDLIVATASSLTPLAPSLDGAWIEVFRAGDYADRGAWTPEQLDHIAATYDSRLHAAPVVLGHPADDAPAYAWVRRLRRAGHSLWAQLEKVDPAFEALLRAGRFAQRSVALYTHFAPTGGPYLRHLGFLGAAPPAVKGLAPVRFADGASVCFAFDTPSLPEVAMPEPKSKLENFVDHLRAFFTPSIREGFAPEPDSAAPAGSGTAADESWRAFADRLTQLEQRLDALTGSSSEPLTPSDPERKRGGAEGPAVPQVANFVESLRARGRFPPAFDRWGVREFMERLAALDRTLPKKTSVILSEAKDLNDAEQPAETPLLTWFQEFLTKLPAVIEFRELSVGASHRSLAAGRRPPVVRFTEPRRGMTVDPASIELAERAEALAAELNITYAEALTRLREEARSTPITA